MEKDNRFFTSSFSAFMTRLSETRDNFGLCNKSRIYVDNLLRYYFKGIHVDKQNLIDTLLFLKEEFERQHLDEMPPETIRQMSMHFHHSGSVGWEVGPSYIRFTAFSDDLAYRHIQQKKALCDCGGECLL